MRRSARLSVPPAALLGSLLVVAACDSGSNPPVASCADEVQNGTETDVDCGGSCGGCDLGETCTAGTDCGSGFCGVEGTCVECLGASDCPPLDATLDPSCASVECNAGSCAVALADARSIADQAAGDCRDLRCDGTGMLVDAVDDSDLPLDGQICTFDVCADGVPSNPIDEARPGCTPPPATGFDAVTCPDAVSTLPEGTACAITRATDGAPGTALVGRVLAPNRVFEPGAVVVDGDGQHPGQITCVGCDCLAGFAGRVVACPGTVVSPGLINTHDHIGYVHNPPYVAADPTVRYEHRHDWRKGDEREYEPEIVTPSGASSDQKSWAELRFVLAGATSMNGSGYVTGLLRNLDVSEGREGLPGGPVEYDTFPLGDSGGTQLTHGCAYPSKPNPADVAAYVAYTPHVAEGINTVARNEMDCVDGLEAGSVDIMAPNTAIIHGVGVTAVEVEAMAVGGSKLIWSPRSNVSLYGDTAPVTLYALAGVPIALGTDWLRSGSMNMLRELACAKNLSTNYFGGFFDDHALWRMATADAALALGARDPVSGALTIGALVPGAYADVAVFWSDGRPDYDAVVDAVPEDLVLVMRGGKILAGDAGLVDSLSPTSCESLDVCGAPKEVCLTGETAKTLAAMTASTSINMYPLFACGTPPDEPTCDPERVQPIDGSTGSSLYPAAGIVDDDHDGVDDAIDDCPGVFNPVRPLDMGEQADFDSDGQGDACDPCPLDPDITECAAPSATDLDRDGVDDAIDDCRTAHDPDQADSDGDGVGDACDRCPNDSNLGDAGCPARVYDLRAGLWSMGDRVALRGVVVTAVTGGPSPGFFVQVSPSSPDWDVTLAERYSGIFVYVGSNLEQPMPGVGDDLDISGGDLAAYHAQLELVNATWLPTSGLVRPAPAVVTPGDVIGTGLDSQFASPYEGVLVKLQDVTVTDASLDAANELEITGPLHVDDFGGYVLSPWPDEGTVFESLTGVVAWRDDVLKVLPRSATDVQVQPPPLVGFSSDLVYQRPGVTGSTLPPLYVQLAYTTPVAREIAMTSDDPTIRLITPVVVPPLARRAEVWVTALAATDNPVAIRATLDAVEVATSVRVLASDAPATLVALEPAMATMSAGTSLEMTVRLDVPAPVGGVTIDVVATPDTAGAPFGSLEVTTVSIPENGVSGIFHFLADAEAGTGSVTASMGSVSLSSAITVEIPQELDLSGFELRQPGGSNGTLTYVIPDGTKIPTGGYLVIGRNADRTAFSQSWGITLGENVVYLNGSNAFPQINGDETYTLMEPDGTVLDGPSIAIAEGQCISRAVPSPWTGLPPAGDAASWNTLSSTSGTPGNGQEGVPVGTGLFVSEFCDFAGTGNYVYEFVELYYGGGEVPAP